MKKDHLRLVTEADLPLLLQWRNHPSVQQFMYTTHEIQPEEHRRWFLNAAKNPLHHLFFYMQGEVPMGFVNLGPIKNGGITDWGFYIAPGSPKGTGLALGVCALNHAFDELLLHKVCGEALGFNKISQKFHKRLGFSLEGERKAQFFDGKNYHEVYLYGLLAERWHQIKDNI